MTFMRGLVGAVVLLAIAATLFFLSRASGATATYQPPGEPESSSEQTDLTGSRPVAPEELRELAVTEAPPSAIRRDERARTGRVEGLLVTELNEPVSAAALRLSSVDKDKTVGPVLVDEEGRFAFDSVKPGEYLVLVDEESLPPRLVAPWRQDKPSQWDDTPAGYYGTVAKVEAAATTSVVVTVHLGATLSGRVVTSDGGTAAGLRVVAVRSGRTASGARTHLTDLSYAAQTDDQGHWEMTNVYAGHHRLQIESLRGLGHLGRPEPKTFFVQPGASLWLGLEVLGGGPMTVRGRVVDQAGEAFEGLAVVAYFHKQEHDLQPNEGHYGLLDVAASSKTDAEGAFEFVGLPRVSLRIQAGTNSRVGAPPGESLIVRWPPQLAVELGGSPRAAVAWPEPGPHAFELPSPDVVALAPLVAERSRPYFVEGRVILDEQWAAAHDATPRSLSLYVVYPGADRGPEQIRLDGDDATFRWGCETPQEPVTLVLEDRRDPDLITPQRVVIFPRASETENITFQVP